MVIPKPPDASVLPRLRVTRKRRLGRSRIQQTGKTGRVGGRDETDFVVAPLLMVFFSMTAFVSSSAAVLVVVVVVVIEIAVAVPDDSIVLFFFKNLFGF
jgi:hypothetical protein